MNTHKAINVCFKIYVYIYLYSGYEEAVCYMETA